MVDEESRIRLNVPPELAGFRVDRAISSMLDLTRSRARELFERGVVVDGSPARPSDVVEEGQVIVTPEPQVLDALEPMNVDFETLYEDEALIVVDKPAGLVTHPGAGSRGPSLSAGLLYRYPELAGVGELQRSGLVHRLDRDTSGALLVGRTPESHRILSEQMRRRDIRRTYLALVDGLLGAPTGTVEAPIGRDPVRPTRRAIVQGGKPARTHYEVVDDFPEETCSLLSVTLETGRTHQIRVHMAAIDHPVIGDGVYGSGATRTSAPRLFLHAARLELDHPFTGRRVVVTSDLPPDLEAVLEGLYPSGPSKPVIRIPS